MGDLTEWEKLAEQPDTTVLAVHDADLEVVRWAIECGASFARFAVNARMSNEAERQLGQLRLNALNRFTVQLDK